MKSGNKSTRDSSKKLTHDIVACKSCPRLRQHCQEVARLKRRSFKNEKYWGLPVPNFGNTKCQLLVVGLAPAAHGGNRTGRMFTGDRSGQWLYRALYRARFANQATYETANDGLKLKNCAITAIAHCAPPDNNPNADEIANCSAFLERTIALGGPSVLLALGGVAWRRVIETYRARGLWTGRLQPFAHGSELVFTDGTVLLGSYHPSQQNTFTKRLTEPMFDAIFTRARHLLKRESQHT